MALENWLIDKSWTLFLDRDGVINQRVFDGYVLNPSQFVLLDGFHEAIRKFSACFGRIVVVTNQQGVGKGLMTEKDLDAIHAILREETQLAGGRIDKIYVAPGLNTPQDTLRKPKTGMALQAKHDFQEIDFTKSVMVGDTRSDMEFGANAGMKTVFISDTNYLNHTVWFKTLKEMSDAL